MSFIGQKLLFFLGAPAQKPKETKSYYRIGHSFTLLLITESMGLGLHHELRYLACDQAEPNLILKVCETPADFPEYDETVVRGQYKGIPWHYFSRPKDGALEVFFYSSMMSVFLATRIVLLPMLKKHLAAMGGFSIIGSCFEQGDKTYVLSGPPGSGKTKLLLEALQNGAKFIGDNELLVTGSGHIQSVFGDMEFRLKTVKKTAYWQQLSMTDKLKLHFYHWLHFILLKQASFNIRKAPQELGLTPVQADVAKKLVFVYLSKETVVNDRGYEAVVREISAYEENYRMLFHDELFSKDDFEASVKHIEAFLARCDTYVLPAGTTQLDDIYNVNKEAV